MQKKNFLLPAFLVLLGGLSSVQAAGGPVADPLISAAVHSAVSHNVTFLNEVSPAGAITVKIDENGKRVNDKGQLIDRDGNFVDADGAPVDTPVQGTGAAVTVTFNLFQGNSGGGVAPAPREAYRNFGGNNGADFSAFVADLTGSASNQGGTFSIDVYNG
jgi:hypothetical protein